MNRRDFSIGLPVAMAMGFSTYGGPAHAFLPFLIRMIIGTGARAALTRGAVATTGRVAAQAGTRAGAGAAVGNAARLGSVGVLVTPDSAIASSTSRLTMAALRAETAIESATARAAYISTAQSLKASKPSLYSRAIEKMEDAVIGAAVNKGIDIISGEEKNKCSIELHFQENHYAQNERVYGNFDLKIKSENGDVVSGKKVQYSKSPEKPLVIIDWDVPPLPYSGLFTMIADGNAKCEPIQMIYV